MTLSNLKSTAIVKWLSSGAQIWIDFTSSYASYNKITTVADYAKLSVAIYNTALLLITLLLIINMIRDLFLNNTTSLNKIFAIINTITIVIITGLFFIKLYVTFRIENLTGPAFTYLKRMFYEDNARLGHIEHFTTFSSALSDAIVVLSLVIGMICIDLLGSKNLLNRFGNLSIFYLFNFFVIIMVSTTNLLVMFLSFEFIFLPTVYFAYSLGYAKKVDKAAEILLIWTLFGSFLVLCCLAYLYYKYNTLSMIYLSQKTFSQNEVVWLFTLILLGFGIKVPLAPFHFWLLKVHVESPTAFSIFLSGFLVKSAFYCLFMFLQLLKNNYPYLVLLMWVLYSLIVGTLGLSRQVDVKKLIAWATIQEMSFILLFLMFKQVFLDHVCVSFLVLHGLMSSFMFYLVDILQRRFRTRSVHQIKGLNLVYPEITKYIWFLVFLFSGFPFTVKFFIEWNLVSLMLTTDYILMLITLLTVNFLGVVFFCRVMFSVLYGTPESNPDDLQFIGLQHKEKVILNYLGYLIITLMLVVFLF